MINILENKRDYRSIDNNPFLIKIKRRCQQKNDQLNKELFSNIDKNSLIITNSVDCTLIKELKNVFECTFAYGTVFKYVLNKNKNCVGMKCMIIKKRNFELEDSNPQHWLEWDKIYSECNGDFNLVHFLYYPFIGKMIMHIGSDLRQQLEIISNIKIDSENKKHINTCLKLFRPMFVNKNYVFPNTILEQ